MGYGWARRLRPSPSAVISRQPRHSYLLRRRLTRFTGQRTREGTVDPSTRNIHAEWLERNPRLIQLFMQWISEVLHFCQGLPIILVGCKKDLRYDQKTIEELHKTSQKPVTPEQVRLPHDSREICSKAHTP